MCVHWIKRIVVARCLFYAHAPFRTKHNRWRCVRTRVHLRFRRPKVDSCSDHCSYICIVHVFDVYKKLKKKKQIPSLVERVLQLHRSISAHYNMFRDCCRSFAQMLISSPAIVNSLCFTRRSHCIHIVWSCQCRSSLFRTRWLVLAAANMYSRQQLRCNCHWRLCIIRAPLACHFGFSLSIN